MDVPVYHDLITSLLRYIDIILQLFVYQGYTTVMQYLAVPMGLAVVLYVTGVGLGMLIGKLNLSPAFLLHSVFRIGLIYTFAFSWGHFSELVIPVFQQAAAELGGLLLKATHTGFTHNIFEALQQILERFIHVGWSLMKNGGFAISGQAIASKIIGLFFIFFGIVITAISTFHLIFAKCMMAILFCLAPLFISLTLFQTTRGFFDRWLGALCSYSFLILMISVTIALSMSLMHWVFQMYINPDEPLVLGVLIPVIFVAIIAFGITLGSQRLADTLGGVVTSLSGASMIGGALGGFLGSSMQAGQNIWQTMRSTQGNRIQSSFTPSNVPPIGALGSPDITSDNEGSK